MLLFRGGPRSALVVLALGGLLFLAGYVAYLARHFLFEREIRRAEAALSDARLEDARGILAPLLDRFPHLPLVQRAAGRALYALGDPLSSASLLEKAARSFGDDPVMAATLVASYAALNRGGDARRASALLPRNADVRLALAWSELVALGGDRAAGGAVIAELRERADVRGDAARNAMASVLDAVAAAHAGDGRRADDALGRMRSSLGPLAPYERAFLGYLEGVALRELGRGPAALAAWERAMETAPGTIGEALARREHANLRVRITSS